MGKIPFKWILIGVLILFVFGYVSIQGPGVQCSGRQFKFSHAGFELEEARA